MATTGKVVKIEPDALTMRYASSRQTSTRKRLLCGLSAIAFFAAVTSPITIDTASMLPGFKSALAADGGNGNGNGDGQGKGNGNGKGKGDENGGGKKPPASGGDDDDGDADDDHGFGDTGGDGRAHRDVDAPRDSDKTNGGDDGEIGDTSYAEAVESLADVPADVPAGLAPPMTPTIQQVFALGEGAVLNSEQEMLAIENGWNVQN